MYIFENKNKSYEQKGDSYIPATKRKLYIYKKKTVSFQIRI